MFLKKIIRLPRTLTFRLTLWYSGIFTLSSIVAFLIFYFLITSVLKANKERDLLEDVAEFSSFLASEGIDKVKNEIFSEAAAEGVDKIFFRLLSSKGEEIAATDMSPWTNVYTSKAALNQLTSGTHHVFETLAVPQAKHKALAIYGTIGPGVVIQIGESLEEEEQFLEILRETFILITAFVMLFAVFGGYLLAKHALRGVDEVTTTALSIAKGDFEQRVPPKARGEEIERLATTFNYMLDRINALINGIRNMTDNIAHDLRSPIARIRGTAEMTLLSDSTLMEYESTVAGTIEECDRLLDMINTMLEISEAEAGASELKKQEIDFADVVQKACDLFQPIADNNGVILSANISAPCYISGDTQKVQRMVANLLDNALKYTPTKGRVTVSVTRDNGRVVSSFSDTGVGISEVDLPHIFKRFYRCDQSRSQAGVGLGLSLAKAIAKSHCGDITVTSCPGRGSTFTIILPRSAHP